MPEESWPHWALAKVLRRKKRYDEAIDQCKEAIRLQPDLHLAFATLGLCYQDAGRFAESVEAFRKAVRYLPLNAALGRELRRSQDYLGFDQRLPAIRSGSEKLKTPDEQARFASFAMRDFRKEYALAFRFFSEAFASEVKLADDLQSQYRYNAARCAALAAAGNGEDAANLDETERTQFRSRSYVWLLEDLSAYAKLIDRGRSSDRILVQQRLRYWQEDSDLSGVRDSTALAKLPEPEREGWRKLWADVENLRKRASEPPK
jgi:tetratricopeptide (TPR) repeat protein